MEYFKKNLNFCFNSAAVKLMRSQTKLITGYLQKYLSKTINASLIQPQMTNKKDTS